MYDMPYKNRLFLKRGYNVTTPPETKSDAFMLILRRRFAEMQIISYNFIILKRLYDVFRSSHNV